MMARNIRSRDGLVLGGLTDEHLAIGGQRMARDHILRKLVEIQYERNDHEFARGVFRATLNVPGFPY